jgi:hypothetical protein
MELRSALDLTWKDVPPPPPTQQHQNEDLEYYDEEDESDFNEKKPVE